MNQGFIARMMAGRSKQPKYGTRCNMRLDELSLVVRRSRRILKDSSSRRIMRPMLVFITETHNQTNYKCLPMSYSRRIMRLWYKNGEDKLSFWTDNASSSIKTANDSNVFRP